MTTIQLTNGQGIPARYANRHGLIAGATGTGKSETIKKLAYEFSRQGVPSFLVDVKGDLSAIARSEQPVQFYEPFGTEGHRLSVSPARLGVDLLARALNLSPAQAGVLGIAERYAAAKATPWRNLLDFDRTLNSMAKDRAFVEREFGHVSAASLATIARSRAMLSPVMAQALLQAPTFDVAQLLRLKPQGLISILNAQQLVRSPSLYAALLTFILTELFERLPEVGDLPAPRLVLFFDEAHMLFEDAPEGLVKRIETCIRLIRSKGVGVFFASQSPSDLPSSILGQLGTRVQHALRAATPADLKAARVAVETLPINPHLDAAAKITSMGVGEALFSTIGPNGQPTPVEIVRVERAPGLPGPMAPGEWKTWDCAKPVADKTPVRGNTENAPRAPRETVDPAVAGRSIGETLWTWFFCTLFASVLIAPFAWLTVHHLWLGVGATLLGGTMALRSRSAA